LPRETAKSLESVVVSRLTWRLLPFLFLLYIVAYLDRINVGFAALQMRGQLNFSDSVYGLGAGMFFAGYFFFQLPSNLVLQRVGARRWIAVLMALWGAVSSSMIFVRTPHEFYLMRFLLGAAEAGFFPGVILYLKNWFPAGSRAVAVALFSTAGALSGVVGAPLSGALLGLHAHGLAGWQWLFLTEGFPAIVLAGAVLVFLTNRPHEADWLTQEQRDWLVETLEYERRTHPDVARANVFDAFGSGRVWLLAFVYFGLNTVSYGMSLWLPSLVRSLSGISNFKIGVLVSIPYIAACIAAILISHNSDRTGKHRLHVAVCAFAGAGGMMIAAHSASVAVSIAAISVAVLSVFSMIGPLWAMPTSFLTGTAAAAGIALINSVGNLGGFFGPYIIGKLHDVTGNYSLALMVVGGTLALGGGVVLMVRTQRQG
jgi:MFS transporter, ACS family, tartrate transporter